MINKTYLGVQTEIAPAMPNSVGCRRLRVHQSLPVAATGYWIFTRLPLYSAHPIQISFTLLLPPVTLVPAAVRPLTSSAL